MGIDKPIFFMAGDLNSIVFKSENSVGMEKISLYFVVGIRLFNHFQRGQILEYNFPLASPCGSVRRDLMTLFFPKSTQ